MDAAASSGDSGIDAAVGGDDDAGEEPVAHDDAGTDAGGLCSTPYVLPSEVPALHEIDVRGRDLEAGEAMQVVFEAPEPGWYAFEVSHFCRTGGSSVLSHSRLVGVADDGASCESADAFEIAPSHVRQTSSDGRIALVLDVNEVGEDETCSPLMIHVERVVPAPDCEAPGAVEADGQFMSGYATLSNLEVESTCATADPRRAAAVFSFTAPEAGRYVFDASRSSAPTVLHALGLDGCGEDAIACSGDGRLRMELAADQGITLVVGAGQERTHLQLAAVPETASCQQPLVVEPPGVDGLDPTLGWDDHPAPEGGEVGPQEVVLSFTPQDAGTYCLEASQEGDQHLPNPENLEMEILAGGTCDSPRLALGQHDFCCDQYESVALSEATLELPADEEILIVIHGRERASDDFVRPTEGYGAYPRFAEVDFSLRRCDDE